MTGARCGAHLVCCLFLLWTGGVVAAEELRGRASRVLDGDSFFLALEAGGRVEVRLAEIDAPEKNQPYANEARDALTALILNRLLTASVIDVDQYGRKVARVQRAEDGLQINAEMVEQGHAWVYRRWVRDRSLFDRERSARDGRRGLWALPEAERQSPWKWRRDHRPAANRDAFTSEPARR